MRRASSAGKAARAGRTASKNGLDDCDQIRNKRSSSDQSWSESFAIALEAPAKAVVASAAAATVSLKIFIGCLLSKDYIACLLFDAGPQAAPGWSFAIERGPVIAAAP